MTAAPTYLSPSHGSRVASHTQAGQELALLLCNDQALALPSQWTLRCVFSLDNVAQRQTNHNWHPEEGLYTDWKKS